MTNMDFRKELYNTISPLLLQNGIRHVDLWNHNVEFIEQEQSWERPAVFIEFAPVRWNAIMPGVEYRAEPEIRLHIVTDWQGCTAATGGTQPTATGELDWSERLHAALTGLCGHSYADFDLQETQTNHNHEDIVESIDTYTCVAFRRL